MMSDKQYFKIEYYEEWYLFDSTTISEQLVKEQAEYGYGVFANSLSPSEICELLNELSEENKKLKARNSYNLEDAMMEIGELKEENDNCKNDYRELFSNYVALEEENKQLKQKLENLNLNEKNDTIKMVDGKVFIRI